VQLRRVFLDELLGDDEAERGDDQRGSEEDEREAERQAEELRLVRDAVDGVDDDEAGTAERRQQEEDDRPGLGARIRVVVGNDALGLRAGRAPAASGKEDEAREQEVFRLSHATASRSRDRRRAAPSLR
jgi:hypothetical protein